MQKLMYCIDLTWLNASCCTFNGRLVKSSLVFLLLGIYVESLTYLDDGDTGHDLGEGGYFRDRFDIE